MTPMDAVPDHRAAGTSGGRGIEIDPIYPNDSKFQIWNSKFEIPNKS